MKSNSLKMIRFALHIEENSMNRKAQSIVGFVIMLMLPDAWSQTTPISFMAVPGDGRGTLRWDSVPNASGYNVNVKQVTHQTAG